MHLTPDEWARLIFPPAHTLTVHDISMSLMCDSEAEETAVSAALILDVSHDETHMEWRQLLHLPFPMLRILAQLSAHLIDEIDDPEGPIPE